MQASTLRLAESEMDQMIKKSSDWLYLTGPAGTAFFVDTFGIHRGLEPKKGSRLLLQFVYAVDRLRNLNYSVNLQIPEILKDVELGN